MYIGIDVGGMSIKAGIVTTQGEIIYKESIVTDLSKDGAGLVGDISDLILKVLSKKGMNLSQIDGIGIGIPGSVNDNEGEVRYCCNINMIGTPIVDILRHSLNFQNIFVSNDANCALLAEVRFGSAQGKKEVMLVTIGTGIGTGIMVGGKIFRGNQSAGGECGHTTILMGGATCGCGKKGHFESYASATGLLNQIKEACNNNPNCLMNSVLKEDGLNGTVIFKAMNKGCKVAKDTFNQYIEYLGTGIVNLINIFYPEVVLIGGGVSNAGDDLMIPLDKYVQENVFGAGYCPKVELRVAKYKNDAGIIGAAALAME